MHEVFWIVGWPQIITLIVSLFGASGTSIWSYFFLHEDLRTRDGLRISTREKWEHIFALLAFSLLGLVVTAAACITVFEVVLNVV